MATATAHTASHLASDRPSIFGRIFDALIRIAESDQRIRKVDALQRLSDEELAARGLKRDDIVRHVFRDSYYL